MKLPALGTNVFTGTSILLFSLSTDAVLTAVDLDGNLGNGHEGVYDDVLDVTWLADANLAKSNTFGVTGTGLGISASGQMNWPTAESFIAAMNADGGSGYLGVNTWRQSTVAPLNGSTFDTTFTFDGSSDVVYQLSAPVDATYNPSGQSPGFTGGKLAYHYYNNFEAIGACSGVGTSNTYGCVSPGVYGVDDAPDTQGHKALFSNIEDSLYWTGTELNSDFVFIFRINSGLQDAVYRWDVFGGYVWPVARGNVAANVVPVTVPFPAWAITVFGGLLGLIGLRNLRKHD